MSIDNICADAVAWRHDLHRHPELAFKEERTSGFVAAKLESFGLDVTRGLAGTGVVGTLRRGASPRAIALRADMDALAIEETNTFAHRSTRQGLMHACGHDGHTAMLLAAARALALDSQFDGAVHFIFQPAEENEGGGEVMIREGLFERFPVDAVYGMHNAPWIPQGVFAIRTGPIMAAFDRFWIEIEGVGAHGALPHTGVDPIPIAAQIVMALQTLVSRRTNPLEAAVVSVTQIHAGDSLNVIPDKVRLAGGVRTFLPEAQTTIETGVRTIAQNIAAAHGANAQLKYERGYPATINESRAVAAALNAARAVVGDANVIADTSPMMASEDFAFMLRAKRGSYMFIGAGGGANTCMVHNPGYDFNDAILPLGVRYWIALVRQELAPGSP
ncbi:MAG: amidohydrolase [Hyphomonadaceae bacterium]|nr:amidohydrolase [Hyphomonadaceae bacterium]